jgi:broad specificity phosphatase PhoE
MPTTFVFVRHAEGYHNVDEKIRGNLSYYDPINIDAELTEFGINQAKTNKLGDEYFDQVFCSPMRRCKQTLLNIYPQSQTETVILDDRLIEQPQGDHLSDKRLDKNDYNSYTPMMWNTRLVSEVNPYKLDKNRDDNSIINFTNFILNRYSNCKVLIVTHGRWLNRWFNKYKNQNRWFNNCECIRVIL